MENDKVFEVLTNIGLENFDVENDACGIVYHTNKQFKATINGRSLICYGFEIITNSFGIDVLTLTSPLINGFELDDDLYRLEVDLAMIEDFAVEILR